jgi:hypothetical protein
MKNLGKSLSTQRGNVKRGKRGNADKKIKGQKD